MPDHRPPRSAPAVAAARPSWPRSALPSQNTLPHTTRALRRLCGESGLTSAGVQAVVLDRPVRVAVVLATAEGTAVDLPIAAGALHSGGRLSAVVPLVGGRDTVRSRCAIDLIAVLLPDLLDADAELAQAAHDLAAVSDLVRTDALTGLGNRRAWEAALPAQVARARRAGLALAVVVIDLDGLKRANDTHGHRHGDRLLLRAAAVLSERARTGDTVCLLGGDEFGVAGLVGADDGAAGLADRLREALLAGSVPASLGAAAAWPDASNESGLPDELWQRADALMYQDKAS